MLLVDTWCDRVSANQPRLFSMIMKKLSVKRILRNAGACKESIDWCNEHSIRTLKEAWTKCPRGDWLLWFAGKRAGTVGSVSRRKLVLASVACARLALPIFEKRFPNDNRVRECLDTTEAYARGSASLEDVRTASAAYAAYANAYADAANAAADAANAAYVASAAYAAARTDMLRRCADAVRTIYPNPPTK
jgi:hypothetical protein